jgi:ABC-type maltose transport system permease subunit
MAATVTMILPVVVIFALAQRFFVRGVTMTGLKG